MSMTGVDKGSGKLLDGLDHLRQSITDILMTPVGSRVMRPDYGSRLYELIDRPVNRSLLIDLYAETVQAILKWEPRIRLIRVRAEEISAGHITLQMWAEYVPDGRRITLNLPLFYAV
jgi:hypothetical protein